SRPSTTTRRASARALADADPVADADGSRARHQRADRDAAVALAIDRLQHVEVALDATGLRARRHDAAGEPLPHGQHGVADLDVRSDEAVLTLAVEEHVGAEPPPVPRPDR